MVVQDLNADLPGIKHDNKIQKKRLIELATKTKNRKIHLRVLVETEGFY